jgi:hypothetical protein
MPMSNKAQQKQKLVTPSLVQLDSVSALRLRFQTRFAEQRGREYVEIRMINPTSDTVSSQNILAYDLHLQYN